MKFQLLVATTALVAVPSLAQIVSFGFTPNATIPDPTGQADFADRQIVNSSITHIADLNVKLVIAGDAVAANGNYYVALLHEGGYAVLLNRVGRRVDQLRGYSDNGFDITLDDQAPNGDVHNYRLTLSPHDNNRELDGPEINGIKINPLTGSWVADGRDASASTVLDSSPRSSSSPLSVFNGLNPNGEWTLLIQDVAAGGSGKLVSWQLDFGAIPEPANLTTGMGLAVLAGAWFVRRYRNY